MYLLQSCTLEAGLKLGVNYMKYFLKTSLAALRHSYNFSSQTVIGSNIWSSSIIFLIFQVHSGMMIPIITENEYFLYGGLSQRYVVVKKVLQSCIVKAGGRLHASIKIFLKTRRYFSTCHRQLSLVILEAVTSFYQEWPACRCI